MKASRHDPGKEESSSVMPNTLTASDLRTLSAALVDLYRPDLRLAHFPERVFALIRALVGTDRIHYGNLNPQDGTMDVLTDFMTPDWAKGAEGFGRCMMKHRMFNFDPSVNDGKPFFVTDFHTVRQFRQLDIYSESFRVLGALHHAALHVPTDDGRLLWFGIQRGGSLAYSERDRQLLTVIQPHLENARRVALLREELREKVDLNPSFFTRLGYSARLSEVAYWLTAGKSNAEIALIMKRHTQTVKEHITALFNKTGTGNRLALTMHLIAQANAGSLINPALLVKVPQAPSDGMRV